MNDHETGMGTRREVLVMPTSIARRRPRASSGTVPGVHHPVRVGGVWSRPGLDRRMRSAITLAALVAVRAEKDLGLHMAAALRNGLTRDEIREVLLHTAIYAGVPAANAAFAVAQRVLCEAADQVEG